MTYADVCGIYKRIWVYRSGTQTKIHGVLNKCNSVQKRLIVSKCGGLYVLFVKYTIVYSSEIWTANIEDYRKYKICVENTIVKDELFGGEQ